MNNPPFPVILANREKYFLHPNGRISRAYKGIYAKSFPISKNLPEEPEDFCEPNDAEFMELLRGKL